MDTQRARRRRPVQPYPELEDDSWQPRLARMLTLSRPRRGAELGRLLYGALAQITHEQRTAIVLFDIEGFDYAEIASMTNVSLAQ